MRLLHSVILLLVCIPSYAYQWCGGEWARLSLSSEKPSRVSLNPAPIDEQTPTRSGDYEIQKRREEVTLFSQRLFQVMVGAKGQKVRTMAEDPEARRIIESHMGSDYNVAKMDERLLPVLKNLMDDRLELAKGFTDLHKRVIPQNKRLRGASPQSLTDPQYETRKLSDSELERIEKLMRNNSVPKPLREQLADYLSYVDDYLGFAPTGPLMRYVSQVERIASVSKN